MHNAHSSPINGAMGKLLRRFTAIVATVLVVALVEPAVSRSVNISSAWLLPQNDFPVFYRHFRDRVTWFEADAVCQFHHAQLVTVQTSTQFEAIRGYLKELEVTENVWIGLKRNSLASQFAWTNYQPLTTGGFFREEVSHSQDPVCVVTDPTANFKWHSLHCGGSEVASFVCELPVPYWASKNNGCMATIKEGMTVTFLPEQPAIKFVKECGAGTTNIVTCKGNMKPSEIMENLTCSYWNAQSSKTPLKPTQEEIKTTTSSSESDLEDYAIEMATISQYNDETFQSLSKVIGRGLPQEMSIDQEPIKETRGGFDTNGIYSTFMGGVPETSTDIVLNTTTGISNAKIAQSTTTNPRTFTMIPRTKTATLSNTIASSIITPNTTIASSTTIAPNTTIAASTTVAPNTTTTIYPSSTTGILKATTYQKPTTTPSTKTTIIITTDKLEPITFSANTTAAGPAGTFAERTPPIVQGSIFTTVPARTIIRDALATSPKTTATVVASTTATSATNTATATSTTVSSTTTKTDGRRHHHHGHHTTIADAVSPTFATTTEKIRTIAKILAAEQRPSTVVPTTQAVTRLEEYVLRTTTAATATATTGTMARRPSVVSTSNPKIPYTMAFSDSVQVATLQANARVPITGSSNMATAPTTEGDVTTTAQHYRRFKKIDFPQIPLDDDYPFTYKPTTTVRTAIIPKAYTPTAATTSNGPAEATVNNIGYYASIVSAETIDTAEMARGTSIKTTTVPQSTTSTSTITSDTQTVTTSANRNNDTTFATTSVTVSAGTTSDPIDKNGDWNKTTSLPSLVPPTNTTAIKTITTAGTTATMAPAVTAGHHKINYDTYTDHPSRSRHIIRPKQQHHHSYPYILYRLLG